MASIFYNNVEYGGAGNEVHYGTTIPASSLGVNGDAYFRLDSNGNLIEQYIKLGSNWTLVPKSDAVLGTKTITQNGTYPASTDSLDGFSSVDVNVSGGGSTLITKSITSNGTYNAQDDSADGYSQVTVNVSGGGGVNIERLCNVVYAQRYEVEIPPINTSETTFDANFNNYLSYDTNTKKFSVVQGFSALVIPWTYEYDNASSTYAHGEFYINDVKQQGWTVDYRGEGYYAGCAFTHTFNAGDTFHNYTPSTDGYPQQFLKVYKIDSSLIFLFNDMFTFKSGEVGGIGRVINY